ncbi:MAG: aminotransferase class III-fold pyridoxal phosphate-dependent enzyme, partial [Proteobacteria bacterium]|nr:aminotransferase class III-fold pyridoxal phosphate-dependent enzyme [Pseudomonadota bacterium]
LPNFLSGLREICDQYRSILIFDEVITGFRVALGGAQALYQVMPDLTTLGKIIGGGMPVGAFGGKRAIMEHLAPLGPVYQAGTLSGNPVAMAAGLETLKQIEKPNFYASLEHLTRQLCEGLLERAKAANIPFTYNQVGSMFGLFFNDASPIIHYEQVMNSNTQLFNQFFHGMLEQGIYLAPSAFESGFVSAAHQIEEIQVTLQAAEKTFKKMKQ